MFPQTMILSPKSNTKTTSLCSLHRQRTAALLRWVRAPYLAVLVVLVLIPYASPARDLSPELAACARIEDDAARLKCFDEITRRVPAKEEPPAAATSVPEEEPSVMSKQWELDPESRRKTFVVRLYRPNYFLPLSYNDTPNRDTILDLDKNAKAQYTEAQFQISFKAKIWQDFFGKDIDLWFGYTQLSFWQLYNSTFSAPFRETDYEPELFLTFRTNYELFGLKGRIINVGLDHQSNGRSAELSRSWNRIVATFGFERKNFNLFLKAWYRLPENANDDDNPDIDKYMGYGEAQGVYYWKRHRFAATMRNNLRRQNKGSIQLDWSFPFPCVNLERFSGYIQYFNGYGESLLDYNNSTNRIAVGIMLTDW